MAVEVINIAIAHHMHNHIADGDRVPHFDVRQVGIEHLAAIYEDHHAGADRFHYRTLGDIQPGVFTKANTQNAGVGCGRIEQATNAATLNEMGINDHAVDEAQTAGDLNFTFEQGVLTATLVDHIF